MIERKTQERLKEKAFDEYKLEFDAEERKEVDELNSFRYGIPAMDEEDR
jgi:flagellar FliJ protein